MPQVARPGVSLLGGVMEFRTINSPHEAFELATSLPDVISVDTEYVKGDPRTTTLLSIIVSNGEWACAFDSSYLSIVGPMLKSRKLIFLQDYNHCDTIILLKHNCDLRSTLCYNLIDMHHIQDENLDHDLGSRVLSEFGDNYKSQFWDKYENFEDAEYQDALEYQCKDAIYTYRLGIKDLKAIGSKIQLYEHIRRTSMALLETQINGLKVNTELISKMEEEVRLQIEGCLPKLADEFKEYCDRWEFRKYLQSISKLKKQSAMLNRKRIKFSFESDKKLSQLLYDIDLMGLPILGLTKNKNPSVDYDTLEKLVAECPEIQSIFDYKQLKSVYSTFIKGLLARVDNNRIYPNFNTSGTKTGRISHSNPNTANLPKEGVIRNFYIPDDGYVLIGADYEQLEVVIELNLTEDPGLKEIILEGKSKHDLFKEELDKAGFNLPRSQVKNINFALQYDAQAPKIAKMIEKCPHRPKEPCKCKINAQRIIDVFYNKFNGVKRVKAETCVILSQYLQVTNLFGRTRHFSVPKNEYEESKQQRQGYNFLIQGVAGDACNRAYWRYHEALTSRGWGTTLFSVHDEIVAQVKPEHAEEAKELLIQIMEEASQYLKFKYPLKAKAYGPLKYWQKT